MITAPGARELDSPVTVHCSGQKEFNRNRSLINSTGGLENTGKVQALKGGGSKRQRTAGMHVDLAVFTRRAPAMRRSTQEPLRSGRWLQLLAHPVERDGQGRGGWNQTADGKG